MTDLKTGDLVQPSWPETCTVTAVNSCVVLLESNDDVYLVPRDIVEPPPAPESVPDPVPVPEPDPAPEAPEGDNLFDEELPQLILRTGDNDENVAIVQRALIALGFDMGSGGTTGKGDDGDYGGKTETGIRHFQQFRMVRTKDGKRSNDDGSYGTTTASYMEEAFKEGYRAGQPWKYKGVWVYGWRHPKHGRMPNTEGKSSTFGGPADKGDRRLSQGRVPAKNAADLYRRYPDLVEEGLFRKDENGEPFKDPLPQVSGVDYSGDWGTGTAGISWLLNPDSFYCALRTRSPQPDCRRARVVFFRDDKACVVVVSDWGPSKSTGRNSDLSPGTLHGALEAKTDDWLDNQCWAADRHPLGLMGRDVDSDWEPSDDS